MLFLGLQFLRPIHGNFRYNDISSQFTKSVNIEYLYSLDDKIFKITPIWKPENVLCSMNTYGVHYFVCDDTGKIRVCYWDKDIDESDKICTAICLLEWMKDINAITTIAISYDIDSKIFYKAKQYIKLLK